MTAEEFYKDHFGHTSQHVSMDKIFVCMGLYVRHQKEVAEENKAIIHMINDKKIEAFKAGVKRAHDVECPVCGSKIN